MMYAHGPSSDASGRHVLPLQTSTTSLHSSTIFVLGSLLLFMSESSGRNPPLGTACNVREARR